MNKNILFISARSDHGGGQEHIYQLLKHIERSSFTPFIAAPTEGHYSNAFKELSLNMYPMPFRTFSFRTLSGLKSFARENHIDIIHSHGKGAGIYSRCLSALTGIPVIHTYHGIHFGNYGKSGRYFYFMLERILSHYTSKLIHVSGAEQALAARLKFYKGDKSNIIYNGIPLERYLRNAESRRSVRASMRVDESCLLLGTVARLCYQKALDKGIEIVKHLRDNNINVHYVIVGDGEDRGHLEKLIKQYGIADNVTLAGFRTDIPALLSAMDVYLSTSRWEGLPYSILEAMASGLAVVASDVTGNNEAFVPDESGILVPRENVEGFVSAITRLYRDRQLKERLSGNALQHAKTMFDVRDMVKKTEQVYKTFQ